MFDHRAADVVVNAANLHRAAQPRVIEALEKASPERFPVPQFFVRRTDVSGGHAMPYGLVFKDVTSPTNMRTMIAAVVPASALANTLPALIGDADDRSMPRVIALVLANLTSMVFDFIARQKVQGQHLNWFILEQLPFITAERFDQALPSRFAAHQRATGLMNGHHPQPTVADFIVPQVLALSYTAHDLTPFARDLGYVDASGDVLPPIQWNEEDRRARLAALDGLFMHLYGLDEADAAHVLDSFPIVREQDTAAFGHYRTKDDVLAQLRLAREVS